MQKKQTNWHREKLKTVEELKNKVLLLNNHSFDFIESQPQLRLCEHMKGEAIKLLQEQALDIRISTQLFSLPSTPPCGAIRSISNVRKFIFKGPIASKIYCSVYQVHVQKVHNSSK